MREIQGHPVADESHFVSVLRDDLRTLLGWLAHGEGMPPSTDEYRQRLIEAVRRIEIALMSPYRDGRIPVIEFSQGPHPDLFSDEGWSER